jgi:hypothetical protein
MNDSSTTGFSPVARNRSYTSSSPEKSNDPSGRTVTVSGRKVPCARTVRTPISSRMMPSAAPYSSATFDPPGPGLSHTSREKCSAPIIRRHTSGSGAGVAVASTDTVTAREPSVAAAVTGADSSPGPLSVHVATA